MTFCLWCDEEIVYQMYWASLIRGSESQKICSHCYKQLILIKGKTCNKCFKPSSKKICNDCKSWHKFFNENDPLIKNISTYEYNDLMKEMIAKWKYRGDYELLNAFSKDIKATMNTHLQNILKEYVIVPIPLSEERLHERGFNQSLAIANKLTDDKHRIQDILERTHGEKQSKKSRDQRIFRKNPFKLTKIINKTVILVDDIYTTGTTLRHAASLLSQSGCPAVYSYTLIRG